MADFLSVHNEWYHSHLNARNGERKGRLERGHQFGEKLFLEKVWWPIHGNLDDLHPEYEILDLKNRAYYADFAWLPGYIKIIFEIKGFGPHVRDMDRRKYCEELNMESYFKGLGFRVVSIPVDDLKERPELCVSMVRMILSRYQPMGKSVGISNLAEREIIRLALQLNRPLRPIDVRKQLTINYRTAMKYIRNLCELGVLNPIQSESGLKINEYEVVRDRVDFMEWM